MKDERISDDSIQCIDSIPWLQSQVANVSTDVSNLHRYVGAEKGVYYSGESLNNKCVNLGESVLKILKFMDYIVKSPYFKFLSAGNPELEALAYDIEKEKEKVWD